MIPQQIFYAVVAAIAVAAQGEDAGWPFVVLRRRSILLFVQPGDACPDLHSVNTAQSRLWRRTGMWRHVNTGVLLFLRKGVSVICHPNSRKT